MIYTELTVKAMKIAYNAHHGQTDKCGVPYVFHPFHLAEQMKDEYTVCAALLHDVVEDTDTPIEALESEFPEPVVNAVKLLTHGENEDYFTYVRRLKSNPIAKAVKLADLEHNSDVSRAALIGESTVKTQERMKYYAEAKRILAE
ncbi:MAG: HD domain-containing protein [Ruminococcus sp.]|nr:HD domain-containing protein [Ruminococcus sp.]